MSSERIHGVNGRLFEDFAVLRDLRVSAQGLNIARDFPHADARVHSALAILLILGALGGGILSHAREGEQRRIAITHGNGLIAGARVGFWRGEECVANLDRQRRIGAIDVFRPFRFELAVRRDLAPTRGAGPQLLRKFGGQAPRVGARALLEQLRNDLGSHLSKWLLRRRVARDHVHNHDVTWSQLYGLTVLPVKNVVVVEDGGDHFIAASERAATLAGELRDLLHRQRYFLRYCIDIIEMFEGLVCELFLALTEGFFSLLLAILGFEFAAHFLERLLLRGLSLIQPDDVVAELGTYRTTHLIRLHAEESIGEWTDKEAEFRPAEVAALCGRTCILRKLLRELGEISA